jgi:hypothetical protein
VENRVEKSANVFDHYRFRPDRVDKLQRYGKEISLISFSQLLSSNRERRTRKPCGEQIRTTERSARKMAQVLFKNCPLWTVQPEGRAGMTIKFDQCKVTKTRSLQSYRLSARSGA